MFVTLDFKIKEGHLLISIFLQELLQEIGHTFSHHNLINLVVFMSAH